MLATQGESYNDSCAQLHPMAVKVRAALQEHGLETPMQLVDLDLMQRRMNIELHMREIIKLLQLDLQDDSLAETPRRIAKLYLEELFIGLDYHHFPEITLITNKMKMEEMVTVRDITLISTCEHHFATIDGRATVAYIPQKKIIGLSKINRIVHFFSRRPQVQERLTQQILVALQTLLESENVAVAIDAVHYCVKGRGVGDVNSATTTVALGGIFKSRLAVRKEFFNSARSTQLGG